MVAYLSLRLELHWHKGEINKILTSIRDKSSCLCYHAVFYLRVFSLIRAEIGLSSPFSDAFICCHCRAKAEDQARIDTDILAALGLNNDIIWEVLLSSPRCGVFTFYLAPAMAAGMH